MEHNVSVFPTFVLVGPLLRYRFDQRQCFDFTVVIPGLKRHRYWWAISPNYSSKFFSSWEERWSGRIAFHFPHLPGFHCYNPGQKSLGQYCNINIFLVFLGSLLKQCSVFEIFLQFSLPPPYTKLKLGKKILDTSVRHCLWGEGRGWTCVNWKTPQKCKIVLRILSMNVWKRGGKNKGNLSEEKCFFGIPMKDRNWTNLFPAFRRFLNVM